MAPLPDEHFTTSNTQAQWVYSPPAIELMMNPPSPASPPSPPSPQPQPPPPPPVPSPPRASSNKLPQLLPSKMSSPPPAMPGSVLMTVGLRTANSNSTILKCVTWGKPKCSVRIVLVAGHAMHNGHRIAMKPSEVVLTSLRLSGILAERSASGVLSMTCNPLYSSTARAGCHTYCLLPPSHSSAIPAELK